MYFQIYTVIKKTEKGIDVTIKKSNISLRHCDYTACDCGFAYNMPAITKINQSCEYIALVKSLKSEIIYINFELSKNCSVNNYKDLLLNIPCRTDELIHIIEYCIRHFLSINTVSINYNYSCMTAQCDVAGTSLESLIGQTLDNKFTINGMAPSEFFKAHSDLEFDMD